MFSRFLINQRAAHHTQTVTLLPLRRQCFSSGSPPGGASSSSSSCSSSSEAAEAVASSFSWLAWYGKQLEKHPWTTKGITSGLIAGTGDVLCQYLAGESDEWDGWRTGRFALLGALWVAPVTHLWYDALSTRFLPGARTRTRVAQRLLLDQFGFAPLFVPSFMAGLWALEGRSDILDRLLLVAPGVVAANWALWIPAQLINFAAVPLNYQVLFSNVVALLWNVYLSWVASSTHTEASPVPAMD